MLQKQTNISQPSSIHSTQSIYSFSDKTLESPPPPFPSIEEDNEGGNKNERAPEEEKSHDKREKELFKLEGYTTNVDIEELLNAFFVVKHKHLFILRSKFRREQTGGPHYLPAVINIKRAQNLRDRCYQFQLILFEIYKGKKLNLLL